ncbi:Carboxysome shell protein CsoS2 [hydrothermal vent metagenome]|uniref:Carboxysome shell protein CsoS2 n=1 Tax=hydrothermal vent metagenome TaxID=652676 RepID=A0A3B0VU12_9ZZZZ
MSKSTKSSSGRSQAIARRKSRGNSAATAAPIATKRAARGVAPQAVTTVKTSVRTSVSSSQPIVVAEGREMAKQRRKQLMSGQSTSAKSQPASRTRQKPKPEATIEPRAKSEVKPRSSVNSATNGRAQVKSTVVEASSGRMLSKARRKSKAKGQAGVAAYKSSGGAASIVAKACNPEASGRDIAKSVRTERGKRGKSGGVSSSDVSKRRQSRKKRSGGSVDKVGFSETLSGQVVSGTQVGQGQLTGAERGDCQLVSGTEYLGMEEFSAHCSEAPAPATTKVTMTQTTKGQTISGNRMGQVKTVTGDRAGLCSGVTGTEYLPADQGSTFCGTQAANMKTSTGGFSIHPSLADSPKSSANNSKVSGGNDFPVQSGSIQPSSVEEGVAPKKVVMSTTFAGNKTSGTQVGRLESVTGVESGYCQSVTGTGYQGQEEVASVCQAPAVSGESRKKVSVSGTFSSKQNVTGDRTAEPLKTTGASKGNFLAGSSFVQQSNVKQDVQPVQVNSGHPLTGAQPGISGLTGAQTGACELVTGTQYQGVDQMNLVCKGSNIATPGESDFPISIGETSPVEMSQPLASVEAMMSSASVITGDGWDSGSKVTGTGAPLTPARNPSIRGMAGQAPLNAANFRPNSMQEVPPSPITGSAGNTSDGVKVTLSGGARA